MHSTEYTNENIPLYKSLVHPDDSALKSAAESLAQRLVALLPKKEKWRILDVGIGGGWTTAKLLQALVHLANGPKSIDLVAIDKNHNMVRCAERTLRSAGFPIQFPSAKTVAVDIRHREFLGEFCDPTPFDVVLGLFFLHHLGAQWYDGMKKMLTLVEPDGVLVLCESSGDIAAWSYCFDKVQLLKDLSPQRLDALGVARRFHRECERVGWHNRRFLAASNLQAALDVLQCLGFVCGPEDKVEVSYESQYTLGGWIKAGDLEHGKTPGFTVFPPDLPQTLRRELYEAIRSEMESRSLGLETPIKGYHTLRFYLLHRGGPPAPAEARLREVHGAFLRSRFSELRVTVQPNEYQATWRRDLVALWQAGVCEKPTLMLTVHWDVLNHCWHEDAPLVAEDEEALKGLILYFAGISKHLGDFKISNVIFNDLPEKTCFQTQYCGDSDFSVEVGLAPDGHLERFTFRIPQGLLTEQFRQNCDQVRQKLCLPKEMKPDEAALPGRYILSARKLVVAAKGVQDYPALNSTPFDEEKLTQAAHKFKSCLEAVAKFTRISGWDLPENHCRRLVAALALGSLAGAEEIWHVPSRDYVEGYKAEVSGQLRIDPREGSAGGVIVFLQKAGSRIEVDTLEDCLNLRNRALYAYQHRHIALVESQHAAEAAIMARNMSHNLGSHALRKLHGKDFVDEGQCRDAARLVDKWEGFEFLSYVQRRMDFVARVATEWPSWRQPMFFFRELVAGFTRQAVLRRVLLDDDGYGEDRVHFVFQSELGGANAACRLCSDARTERGDSAFPEEDPLVDVPAGLVGAQAFCAFLENAMRNAALHNKHRPDKPDRMTVLVHVREAEDCYVVTYADNLSVDPDNRIRPEVSGIIEKEPLVDEATGRITGRHWGCQEMKVCARFLRYDGTRERRYQDCLQVADDVTLDGSTGQLVPVLAYRFPLQRARLIAGIDVAPPDHQVRLDDRTHAILRRIGCDVVHIDPTGSSSWEDRVLEQVRRLSPGLVLLRVHGVGNGGVEQFLRSEATRLPRALRWSGELPTKDSSPDTEKDAVERWILQRYKDWVLRLADRHELGQLHLVLFHSGSEEQGGDRNIPTSSVAWNDILDQARGFQLFDDRLQVSMAAPQAVGATGSESFLWLDDHSRSWFVDKWTGKPFCGFRKRLLFWQRRGFGNRTAKQAIEHPVPGFGGLLFLLKLVEACLLRVLIIDERVAEHVFIADSDGVLRRGNEETLPPLVAAGIHIVPGFWSANGQPSPLSAKWKALAGDLDRVGIHVSASGTCEEVLVHQFVKGQVTTQSLKLRSQGTPNPPFDVVVIHRTQVDALARVLGKGVTESMQALGGLAPKLVITSGRGTLLDEDPLKQYPFVEFSVIESYVIREIWKYGLTSALMAAL